MLRGLRAVLDFTYLAAGVLAALCLIAILFLIVVQMLARWTGEVFPGAPTVKDGFMYVNEAPGFGVDIDEAAAKKHPLPDHPGYWEPVRRRDGTSVRP